MGARSLSCPIEHYSVRGIDLIIIATQNQTAFTISKSKTDKNIEKINWNQQKKGSDTHKCCQQMKN